MSLAERFKKHIENNDIFKNTEKSIHKQNGNDVKFISKPFEQNETPDIISSNINIPETPSKSQDFNSDALENVINRSIRKKENRIQPQRNILAQTGPDDIEIITNELLNKIAKTPYWNEFSNTRKEKMIKTYFLKRIPQSEQSNISDNIIKDIVIKTTK